MVSEEHTRDAARLAVAARDAIRALEQVGGAAWAASVLAEEAARLQPKPETKAGRKPPPVEEEALFLSLLSLVQAAEPALSAPEAAARLLSMVKPAARTRWHSEAALAQRIVRTRRDAGSLGEIGELTSRAIRRGLVETLERAGEAHGARVLLALLEGRGAALSEEEREYARLLAAVAARALRPGSETK